MKIPDFRNIKPATEEQISDWVYRNEVIPRLDAGGFDARYFFPVEMTKPQRSVFARMKAKLKGVGAIVALAGIRGTGKTSLVAAIAQERAANEEATPNHRTVLYRRMTALVTKYKPLYADFGSIDTDSLVDSRDAICRKNLLIIDEVHESDDQKLKNRILTDIVDRRYASLHDTVLISNQPPEEFRKTTSDSIMSRLAEHGVILDCKWPTFRTSKEI